MMVLFRIRSMTAVTISLWLGVLACLLGCANPAAASTSGSKREIGGVICPESGREAGDSCCQHSHGNPDNRSHHAKSCCPTETALTERKHTPIPLLVSVDFATPALPLAVTFPIEFVSLGATLPTVEDSGRDILRKVHVLRI